MEWSFLKKVMLQMGFDERWVALIMECITTVTYSILINGKPMGNIKPSRGIRHGDPLSPYLFWVCSKGLHRMIQKTACNGDINGVSICHNGLKLTCSLQMIAFCFVGLLYRNAKRCWRFLLPMRRSRGKD